MKLSTNDVKIINDAEIALKDLFKTPVFSSDSFHFLKETEEKLKEKNQIELVENCFELLIALLANTTEIRGIKSPSKSEKPFYHLSEPYSALSFYSSHLSIFELVELLKMISKQPTTVYSNNHSLNNMKLIDTTNVIHSCKNS